MQATKLELIRADIDDGVPKSARKCALANAARRRWGWGCKPFVAAGRLQVLVRGTIHSFPLGQRTRLMVEAFDSGRYVAPGKYPLDSPDSRSGHLGADCYGR